MGISANGASPILFDHDADGVKTGTGWLKGDDAWLVMDRDGNGTIDSGRELFGVDTQISNAQNSGQTITRNAKSGFEALASLDTGSGTAGSGGYGDGVFDSRDVAFTLVKLWQDLNQDGISQANELFTLADKGIVSIGLTPSTNTINLGNGNTVTGQAKVTRSNGTATQIDSVDLQASNLNLADNPFYREFISSIPVSAVAQALPEMGGSGWLRDLREAMSLGTPAADKLTQLVTTFAATTTRDEQTAQLDALLWSWAGTTGRLLPPSIREAFTQTLISSTSTSNTYRYTAADPTGQAAGGNTPLIKLVLPSTYYVGGDVSSGSVNAQGGQILTRMNEMEAFNGSRFATFTGIERISTDTQGTGGGGGSSGVQGPYDRFLLTVTQQQVDAVNAAHNALRDSVYGALGMLCINRFSKILRKSNQ